ncbi:MAG: PorV/PorQ family protein [bacterium]
MKTIRLSAMCLVAVLLATQVSISQDRKAGLTGAAFLKVGVGARAVALGSAVTALYGDVNQMFYNPAGIALTDQTLQATFNYNKWIADLGTSSAAVSYNLEGVGTIGVGVITLGLSNIPADRDFDPDGNNGQFDKNTGATYNYRDIAYQATFSKYVIDQLSLGITLKGITQSIDGVSASAFALDFGSVYHIGVMDWTIAARFNNLGSDLKYFDIAAGLPLQFTIGTAMSPIKTENSAVMLAVDAAKPQDGPLYLFSGIEYSTMDLLAFRFGYKFNYSGTTSQPTLGSPSIDNTIEGFSAGLGVHTTYEGYTINVDYAYTKMQLLDNAHRFTVSVAMK